MLDEIVTFISVFHHHDCFLQFHLFLSSFPSCHQSVSFVYRFCVFCFFHCCAELWMSFICSIFILDEYTNHWSMQSWILYMSSKFSSILLWRYLSSGRLRKAAFLRLSASLSSCFTVFYCSYCRLSVKLPWTYLQFQCPVITYICLWMAQLQFGGLLLIFASGQCH